MKTLFNSIVIASCVTLSASADKAHDAFSANKDAILAQTVSVCGEVAFSVGRAVSPRNRGDSVGYAKAEEQAKWNLGDKYRAIAAWPDDIEESEKDAAWTEYRIQHPKRFSVFGMQRILTKKTPPDNYLVVMSFPADQVDVPKPSAEELKVALEKIRERKRIAEERARKQAEEAAKKAQTTGDVDDKSESQVEPLENQQPVKSKEDKIQKFDNLDEDLML